MAKAKKTEPKSTAAPSAGAGKKKSTKPKANVAPGQAPLVDTNLAAEAAAKRVVAGLAPSSGNPNAPKSESASFKSLKESLNKPSTGLGNLLDRTGNSSHKPNNLPFQGGKQTGRNQTFGADVNRAGVPRRTGGG